MMTLAQIVIDVVQELYERTGQAPYAREIAEEFRAVDDAALIADILHKAAARGEVAELLWQYPNGATLVYAPLGVTKHGRKVTVKNTFEILTERLREESPTLGGLYPFALWLAKQQHEGRGLSDLLEEECGRENWTEKEVNERLSAAMGASGRYADHGDGDVSLISDSTCVLSGLCRFSPTPALKMNSVLALFRYLIKLNEIRVIREQGRDQDEETPILDEMDEIWEKLSESDRDVVRENSI